MLRSQACTYRYVDRTTPVYVAARRTRWPAPPVFQPKDLWIDAAVYSVPMELPKDEELRAVVAWTCPVQAGVVAAETGVGIGKLDLGELVHFSNSLRLSTVVVLSAGCDIETRTPVFEVFLHRFNPDASVIDC